MPQAHNPTIRGRKLARELHEIREQSGLIPEEAANHLGWSRQKLMRIEKAQTKVGSHDLDAMLDLYGVPTPRRELLVQLSRDAWKRGWWTAYRDVFNGIYLALEDEAAHIRAWEPQVVPGILQIPEYARSIFHAFRGDDAPDLDHRVAARIARRALLSRPNAPNLHFIIDESVLRREIGGRQIIRAQLESLLRDLERPNITLQVLPYAAGSHRGLAGTFVLMSFDSDLHPDVGYIEYSGGALYLESQPDIAWCGASFEDLSAQAASPDKSQKIINQAVKEFSDDL